MPAVALAAPAAGIAATPVGPPGPSDLLLDGLAVLVTEGRAAAAPLPNTSSIAARWEGG